MDALLHYSMLDVTSFKILMQGKYNHRFYSPPITEKREAMQRTEQFYDRAIANPLVNTKEENLWGALQMLADAYEIRNLESFIKKPRSAYVLSATEAIQRIMSGQFNIIPDPQIDAAEYLMRIEIFIRTDTFAAADQRTKAGIMKLHNIATHYNEAQKLAIMDAQTLRAGMEAQAMAMSQPEDQGAGKEAPQNGKAAAA